MAIDSRALIEIAAFTQTTPSQTQSVLQLILDEECTVPFIARYRKERTGGLDEVKIRLIFEGHEEYQEKEKRREFILETLKKKEVLTPELEKILLQATTLQQLEDIYAPFKSKRKTKAQIAKEKGIEPLADLILSSNLSLAQIEAQKAGDFVPGPANDVTNFTEAISLACDILIERFSHHQVIKDKLRQSYWEEAIIVSAKREGAEEQKDHLKYKDFFDHKDPVRALKNPKATHRFLAMRRGQKSKILKVEIEHPPELAYHLIQKEFFPSLNNSTSSNSSTDPARLDLLKKCSERAYLNYIHPSLDLEIKTDLKKFADTAAIEVFGRNLKDLLLAPYLGSEAVMGVDPGVRSGCKIAVVDSIGKLVHDQVIFPFTPHNDIEGSKRVVDILINHFHIKYIAIGNGTFGRETLSFLKEHIASIAEGQVKATLISEAGASIYSASDLAREEFPDKDPTVRGAVSIARRFQDPLAELVKIDPKSIGVGQYQHDVNQTQMKKTLSAVVESCVNYVGVDLNTASAPLLSFISGLTPALGKSLVQQREETGRFKSREDLLKIPRFTSKIYQQCAGFLRIYEGSNPLDSTFIHPENYGELTLWAKDHGLKLKELVRNQVKVEELKQDQNLKAKIGEMTLQDIVNGLLAPTQDPRNTFQSVEFEQGLNSLEDIKLGQNLKGVVTNITMFGAFVDIGIKEQGLLHISQLSDTFVQNAFDLLQVGQEIQVKVLSVDLERRRLGLTRKQEQTERKVTAPSPRPPRPSRPTQANDQSQGQSHDQKRSEQRPPRPQRFDQDRNRDRDRDRNRDQNRDRARDNNKGREKERPRHPRRDEGGRPLNQRPFSILKNFKIEP